MDVPWRERSRLVLARRRWQTRRPRTFNEKVRYKMVRDHRPLLVTFADKVAVREHVAAVVGDRHLPVLYGVLDDPAALRSLTRPASWVLKPTHGSGAVVAVSPDAPAGASLPDPDGPWEGVWVRPAAADPAHLERLAAAWLRRTHGEGPNTEWAYSAVRPRLLVEEFLTAPGGGIPDDHKLWVFHGRCHWIQVDGGRFGRHTQDFFTRDWEHVPLSGGPLPHAAPLPERPADLAAMIDVAERLGADTDFVRVDLYALPGRVVVGELTNYPAAGKAPFDPPAWDLEFGRPWHVPRRYR